MPRCAVGPGTLGTRPAGAQRAVGLAGDRLLVQTDDGLLALSTQTGKVLWSHLAPDLLDCYPQARSNTLLCLRAEPCLGGQCRSVLEWVDVQSGRTAGRCELRGLQGKQPPLGCLAAHDGRLWCFAAVFDPQGTLQPKRRLVEVVAAEGPPASPQNVGLGHQVPMVVGGLTYWTAQVDPGWPLALEKSLPGWTLLSGSYDGRSGLLSPTPGMPEVLVTRAAENPANLVRQVSLPAGHPQLVIEMGHASDGTSRLEARVNGVLYRQWSSQAMKNDKDWQKIQVDLSAVAGRTVWILITQERTGGGAAYTYWKSVELQGENRP